MPILILGMGGHYFLRDNEVHYEVSASPDKEYVVIEGASHGIRPCKACETFSDQYSNTVKNTFDYVQKWINARFGVTYDHQAITDRYRFKIVGPQ